MRPVLDQGPFGICVGAGFKHWMLAAPVCQTTPTAEPTMQAIYREAILLDEWADNDQDGQAMQFGTSVRAGAKALQARGILHEYGWAFDVDTAIDWLCSNGPVVIGVNFYEGMESPGPNGFMRVTGSILGGHCMCVVGWSETRGAVRLLQSWGPDWGQKGRAWLSGEDLARLIHEDGECCTALETRVG
jgi:hypothetical protein